MNPNKLISFLVRAKKSTYAGDGLPIESSSLGSRDLEYHEDNLQ